MISIEELYELEDRMLTKYRQHYVRIIDNLPKHYFPKGVLGFTRLMWEAFINPDEYYRRGEVVKHERVHNLYPDAPEGWVRSHARYLASSCIYC